ncbi:MAG: hypothetical protein RLN79_08915 [Cytophagales bacterium]
MRILLIPFLTFALAACTSDNFNETKRYFETPRDTISLNGEFELTVVIESEKEKSIRFYENFRNLTIWTSLRVPCENDSTEWCNKDMLTQNIGRGEETNIKSYKISKDQPFRKSFKCIVEERDGRFLLSIPELQYYANYDLAEFDGITKLGLHGHCAPINAGFGASLEDYIELKELDIILEPNKQSMALQIPILGTLNVESNKLDSLNEYGAGDCWGNIRHYSGSNNSIAIDSMTCSEYGFTYTNYYLENEGIRIVYIQESSTQLAATLEKRTYMLSEKIYDYHEQPFKVYTRSGRFKSPDFGLINSKFNSEVLQDFQTTYEHLTMSYQGAWEMEIDY